MLRCVAMYSSRLFGVEDDRIWKVQHQPLLKCLGHSPWSSSHPKYATNQVFWSSSHHRQVSIMFLVLEISTCCISHCWSTLVILMCSTSHPPAVSFFVEFFVFVVTEPARACISIALLSAVLCDPLSPLGIPAYDEKPPNIHGSH